MRIYNIFAKTKWTIELIIELVVVSLYLGALLAPYVSPIVIPVPAVLNIAFPIIFVLFGILTVGALLRRRWKYLGVHAVLLIVSLGYIKTYFPMGWGRSDKPQDLRVMTYNVSGFSPYKSGVKTAEEIILDSGADIVCLQEAIHSRDEGENAQSFRKYFGRVYPHREAFFDYKTHTQGLVLLSKYPILKKHKIEYPYKTDGNASVAYIIKLPSDKKVLVVNNHLESYRLTKKEKDTYTNVTKQNSLRRILGLLKSLYGRLGKPLSKRAQAAEQVYREILRLQEIYKPDYTVVTGDMNDTPMSYTYTQMKGDLYDAYKERGRGLGVSYNEPLFYFRIDHLFYGGAMKPLRADVLRCPGSSDHNPLVVDFMLGQ